MEMLSDFSQCTASQHQSQEDNMGILDPSPVAVTARKHYPSECKLLLLRCGLSFMWVAICYIAYLLLVTKAIHILNCFAFSQLLKSAVDFLTTVTALLMWKYWTNINSCFLSKFLQCHKPTVKNEFKQLLKSPLTWYWFVPFLLVVP